MKAKTCLAESFPGRSSASRKSPTFEAPAGRRRLANREKSRKVPLGAKNSPRRSKGSPSAKRLALTSGERGEQPAVGRVGGGCQRDCPACELTAPVMGELARRAGITVYTQDDPFLPDTAPGRSMTSRSTCRTGWDRDRADPDPPRSSRGVARRVRERIQRRLRAAAGSRRRLAPQHDGQHTRVFR
jgi:hypothetical protein